MAAGDKTFWSDVANAINPPIVRLVQQAAQAVVTATTTAVTFGVGSEDEDTHNFHDTAVNPSRVTPTVAGKYLCTATVAWASNTVTQSYTAVGKNGAIVQPLVRHKPAATAAAHSVQATAIVSINGTGDYVEALGNHNAGVNLNTQVGGGINSTFEVIYLRPL